MTKRDELFELIQSATDESAALRETVLGASRERGPSADFATVDRHLEAIEGGLYILASITDRLSEVTRELLRNTRTGGEQPESVTWEEATKPDPTPGEVDNSKPAPGAGVTYDDLTVQAASGELIAVRFTGKTGKFRMGVIHRPGGTSPYFIEADFNAACLQDIGEAIRDSASLEIPHLRPE